MAGSTVDWSALKGIDPVNASVVTVECTVVTGFEREAEKEARLKLGLESVEKTQGRQGSTSSVSIFSFSLSMRFIVSICFSETLSESASNFNHISILRIVSCV